MTPAEVRADALRWALRRAIEAEDRAERWIGWGRRSDRADQITVHVVAVARVAALRDLCDELGLDCGPDAKKPPA